MRSQGSRGRWVSTTTGARKGGGSGHPASPSSNMRLPMTYAPVRANLSSISALSGVASPPDMPSRSRNARAPYCHAWMRGPPSPKGLPGPAFGPAT